MKLKFKVTAAFIFCVCICISCFSYANNILNISDTETTISGGVILKEYEILTSDGWVEAQVLELDLDSDYLKLGILTAKEGVKKLSTISNMISGTNFVAGINGDFFAGSNGIGSSIGLSIDNGEVLSSSAEDNRTKEVFTSFLLDENQKAYFEYISDEITIICGSGKNQVEVPARYINKYTDNTDIPTIYTKSWGEYSIGSTEILPVTEIVIENNKVIEIRDGKGPVEIPENGFVIMATGENAQILKENLNKKTIVKYEHVITPNIENVELAISGGTKIIENGIIPESYTHNVTGKNPRTILGINKKKDKVYLITIDGRSKSSIGMTLDEVSEFLKEINIYSAINLDGGGSTTMVAQKLGEEEKVEINNPSSGTERMVANGIGIISTAPDNTKLYGLSINVEDHNVFVNEPRKISVTGYNKYYMPVEIDEDDIKWDYNGVDVKIKDMILTGSTVGSTNIIAKIGKVKAECEINILSEANEIIVNPKEKSINPGESVNYRFTSKNRNGYYAATDQNSYDIKIYKYYNDDIESNIPDDAKVENNTFSAATSGTYILEISKGTCKTYAKVIIAKEKFFLIDGFEKDSFTFDPYPDEVGGSATRSNEQKFDGEYSAKLEYDFDRDAKVRGAYIVLNEEAVIPSEATAISFYVYNDEYKDEKIKIKLKDGNNDTRLIVVQDNILHEGWKEFRYDISSLAKPLKVSDIYLAQNDEDIREKGQIYVDSFGYYANTSITQDNVKLPNDQKLEDQNNISVNTKDSFNIAFLSEFDVPETMIDVLKTKRLVDDINENTEMTAFISNLSENFKNAFIRDENEKLDYGIFKIEKITNKIFVNEGYDLFSNDLVTIISMDISQKGIRNSDEEQYFNFEDDIKDDDTGNVIIVLNGTLEEFSDEKERRLFVDKLCELKRETSKNIIVIQKGYNQDYSMERGVKFLSIKDTNINPEDAKDSKYLIVSVNKKQISYEYKNVF